MKTGDGTPRGLALRVRGAFHAWAPLSLLALGIALAFAFNIDRAHYYAPFDHNTAKNLAIAENLSFEHNLRTFTNLSFGADGEPAYQSYSRFPIGGYALLKAVMLPFGDDMAAKTFAARLLMLAFFSAAALLAYQSVVRIASNKWIAAAAVLIAFSNYYVLVYANWVNTETMMGLLAVMLTFHGITVFLQDGRFRQLAIKTCVALMLDWHVYAFLAPFLVLGFGSELIAAARTRRESSAQAEEGGGQTRAQLPLSLLTRSRYVRLGVIALLFGSAILSFNFITEYSAASGERSLSALPSVDSMLWHLGFTQETDHLEQRAWGEFLPRQFYRVAGSVLPFGLTNWSGVRAEAPPNSPPLLLSALGALFAAAALIGLLFARHHRILLATLALSGFCWSFPLRNNTAFWGHQFEAIYYIGVPLTLVALLMLAASRSGWSRFFPVVAVAALAIFALSSVAMFAKGPEEERVSARIEAVFSDLANIREAAIGKNILAAPSEESGDALFGNHRALDFHLSGSRINYAFGGAPGKYDLVLFPHHRGEATLTPENNFVFLYGRVEPSAIHRSWLDSAASAGEPEARSVYDLYFMDGALVYVKEQCSPADVEQRFFLHIFPERRDALPEWRREYGYDNLDFTFHLWGLSLDGVCIAQVPLPDYDIDSIRTGQFGGRGRIWEAKFAFDPNAPRTAYEAVASREPDARSTFDLHLDEENRTLTYVKDPCAASDIEKPFFLHVRPARSEDLPDDRRDFGFDNLDFDFRLEGGVFDGKCAAQVALPDYAFASLRTGQWVRGAGVDWEAALRASQ